MSLPFDPPPGAAEATRLYIVRHGETEYNRRKIVQGRKIDSTLNGTGIEQAHALGRRLQETAFGAVYASNLRRALQTAYIVSRYQPRPSHVHASGDLAEMSWGIFEGRPLADPEVRSGIGRARAEWEAGRYDQPVSEGESIVQVRDRGVRAVRSIVANHAGEDVLVVTHGRFIRILLASLLDGYDLSRMDEIEHANTGVNVVVHEASVFRPQLLNDTAHLLERTPAHPFD